MNEHTEQDAPAGREPIYRNLAPSGPPLPAGAPIPPHVYLGVGTICDWCNREKSDALHIPPPPNPANEPPGPPAHDSEPPKTPWFLRDEERADFSFLVTLFADFANPAKASKLNYTETASYFRRAAAAIERLLEADIENRKELERLTQEAQTLLNTIARPESGGDPSGAPPPLDPAAFYRPKRTEAEVYPDDATEERYGSRIKDALDQYAKDLIGLKEQQIDSERRRLAELAEEFRRYIYETAQVDAKAIALIEAAGK